MVCACACVCVCVCVCVCRGGVCVCGGGGGRKDQRVGSNGQTDKINFFQSWKIPTYLSRWQSKQTWPRLQCTVPWPWAGCPGAAWPSPPRCPARSVLRDWRRWPLAWGRLQDHGILAPPWQSPSPAASDDDTKEHLVMLEWSCKKGGRGVSWLVHNNKRNIALLTNWKDDCRLWQIYIYIYIYVYMYVCVCIYIYM